VTFCHSLKNMPTKRIESDDTRRAWVSAVAYSFGRVPEGESILKFSSGLGKSADADELNKVQRNRYHSSE